MKRNLKFWTRYTFESAEAVLVCTAVLSVLTLFSAEGLDFVTFASAVPYFLIISAIFVMLMINAGSQALYVPLLVSMGETRRNVLLGFQYYRLLVIAVTLAACSLIWLFMPEEVSASSLRSLPTLLCVLLMASAMGGIMGTLWVRWKWVGTICIVIICGAAGAMIGFVGGGGDKMLSVITLRTTGAMSHLEKLPWWLPVAVLGALGADVLFQWLLLRRREVKL